MSYSMADRSKNILLELQQRHGNSKCADCGLAEIKFQYHLSGKTVGILQDFTMRNPDDLDLYPQWASCTLGIFLCQDCAGIHRSLTSDISRVKSIHLDKWEESQLQIIRNILGWIPVMKEVGNDLAKEEYEKFVPFFYKRPTKSDPSVLKNEWIHAKYGRREFIDPARQNSYNEIVKEGILLKRGKDDKKFSPRKFILSRKDNVLSYYNKERALKPKAVMCLDDVNAVFVPDKIGNSNGLQITYDRNGSTRSIFVFSHESKEIVDWYYSMRAAKLERRQIAFPDKDVKELAEDLTRDFPIEGWLSKKGPRDEPFRRRWFTVDRRKIMYFEDPLNAFAKGEIFIGHKDNGYSVYEGIPDGGKSAPGYGFTLKTPERSFYLCAESKQDMERWIIVIMKIMETPLTPQDNKVASNLVTKRSSSIYRKIKK